MALALASPPAWAKPRPPLPPLPEARLGSWRFDDTLGSALPLPTILATQNVTFAESWSGYALNMAGPQTALYALRAQATDGRTLLPANKGTVRFYFAPDWSSAGLGSGPGGEARLLEAGNWSAQSVQSWWSLRVNAAGTSVRLLVRNGAQMVEHLQAPIQWTAGAWHQVALVWSAQGGTVLYLDGQRAAQGAAVTLAPLVALSGTPGFCLGSDAQGDHLAQGQFEELTTFAQPCADAELAAHYQFHAPLAALGPVTLEEEQEQRLIQSFQAMEFALEAEFSGLETPQMLGAGASNPCGLWLEIAPATSSSAVLVTLHNTVPGKPYKLMSKTDLAATSWAEEQTFTGTTGQDWTERTVSVVQRPVLFFQGVEVRDYVMGHNFKGVDEAEAGGTIAADTVGAVGPNHFVELVNGQIAVFEKTTGNRVESTTMLDFFSFTNPDDGISYPVGGEFGYMTDPRVLYDHQAQRWVACAIDINSNVVLMAVSNGSNPAGLSGNWTRYLVRIPRQGISHPDYVTLGLDLNGIYLTVLHHGPDLGHTVVAIKKPEIYNGTYVAWFNFMTLSYVNASTIQPAVNFDSAPVGGYAWFIAKGPPEHSPIYKGGAVRYRRLKWNGNTVAWQDQSWQNLPEPTTDYRNYFDYDDVNYFAPVASAPQAGSTVKINFGNVGSRLMMAMIRNGHLYTCQHVGLNGTDGIYDGGAAGTSVDRSGVQWLKLAIGSNGEGLTLANRGRIFDRAASNPFWYYFPSLAVNVAGDMALGFSGSSATHYIGAYYAWQPACGMSVGLPRLVHDGEIAYEKDRWGDYSYTSVDPADGLRLWSVQQYAKRQFFSGEGFLPNWSSWIFEIIPQP